MFWFGFVAGAVTVMFVLMVTLIIAVMVTMKGRK